MRSFYHCKTARYSRRAVRFICIAATICAETAAIAFFMLFFGLFGSAQPEYLIGLALTAAVSVIVGCLLCLWAGLHTRRKIRRMSRYTYLDIQLKAAVVSVYSGDYTIAGERCIMRDLYYIPFSGFTSAEVTRSGKKAVIRGNIRKYFLNSESLGYHVKNGDIEFDRSWLNIGAYQSLPSLEIPAYFGSPKRICRIFSEAKSRFDAIPKPVKRPLPQRRPQKPDSLALRRLLRL